MISKIGIQPYSKSYINNNLNNSGNKNEKIKFQSIPFDTISFSGDSSKKGKQKKLDNIMLYADASAKKMFNNLWDYAQKSGYDSITPMHVIGYSINETAKYLDDLDSGVKDYTSDKAPELVFLLGEAVNYNIFSDKEQRQKIEPIIKEYVKKSQEILLNEKPQYFSLNGAISLSDDLVDNIWSYRKKENETVDPNAILLSTVDDDSNQKILKFIDNLADDISDVIMQKNDNSEEQFPYSGYDEKAKNVIKNLFLGTDMFITYDYTKENANSFLDTVRKNIKSLKKII